MQSPKCSVNYNQDDEDFAEVLRSSWIRRLHLKPTSQIVINKQNPLLISPQTAADSPSTAGSNDTVICHPSTISTDQSCTPSSIYNALTTPFLHRFLKPQIIKPSLKTDPENSYFPGFGPFQVKNKKKLVVDTDKVTSLVDDDGDHHHLIHNSLEVQEGSGNCEIRNLGKDLRLNSSYTWNSCEHASSINVDIEEEKKKRESNSFLQENWFSKILSTEKALFSSESNLTNNLKMGSFSDRYSTNDQHEIHPSPFFRYYSDSKKNGCLTENTAIKERKNITKSTNSDSSNINHLMCSPSSKALTERDDQIRAYRQCLPMNKVSHDINYLSRIQGITCHESCNYDGAGGRILREPYDLTHHNAVLLLNQHDQRHSPTDSNETEKPSSFWNMNRFQKGDVVSSGINAYRSGTKKRNPDPNEFVFVKSRKLVHDD